ncbi:hypothetical protein FPG87_12600 [Flavobacterium psychrophilum]|uniref:YEATS-associated helix-containing protein n=1 Tax=Flavobacterium psychrophilum TaxID=96345 RepID=UPI0009034C62|nr:YEATS-associated helix-containing protein [Flavobacterium psychrophilum]OJH13711.1 hypothetical protein FPG87_12600 [Flavobacterium psychrophilum]
MTHTVIIILIIIFAGILGGLTNFFLILNLEHKSKECWLNFFKSLFLSLCASATVPLFLQIISNNLLDLSTDGKFPDKNYFILAGFCVLSAFFSKRFLEDLYAKVNKAEEKAEEAKQQVAKLENKNQEIDDVSSIVDDKKITDNVVKTKYTIEQISEVTKATVGSKYNFRTVKGVAAEINYSEEDVKGIFNLLLELGYAEKRNNRENKDVWKIIYPEK